ncbi:MAG: hypothetical protein WAL38_28830 [Solirubrobacteraceae bacterium]
MVDNAEVALEHNQGEVDSCIAWLSKRLISGATLTAQICPLQEAARDRRETGVHFCCGRIISSDLASTARRRLLGFRALQDRRRERRDACARAKVGLDGVADAFDRYLGSRVASRGRSAGAERPA